MSSEIIPFPKKKYNIILADPPWSYADQGCQGTMANHYHGMTLADICKLPVGEITDENCILFLWTTYPMLKEAFQVIEAWEFTYKTVGFTWIKKTITGKDHFGVGMWTRKNPEMCLLATKGKPKRLNAGVRQLQYFQVREHSRKPDEIRDKIVELCGDLPRIELFARPPKDRSFEDESFEGWDVWGNEV